MSYRSLYSTLAASACIVALATPAAAQTRSFNIPAGDLATALDSFARQSGLQIIYKVDEVQGRRSKAVKGNLDADDALRRLLSAASLGEDDGVTADSAEIVVTAQKRAERLIDTPQSIAVLSGETLAKSGATQFRDFANNVAGLSYTTAGAGFSQVTLRGVSSGYYDISPTVGIYVDEVPYGSSTGFANGAQLALDVGLFDIDRIEVLRGPQGTLYGASTMGGLLKYVSAAPDAREVSGEAQAGLSSTRRGRVGYNAAAAVNLPLSADKVGLRVSGFYSQDGGYVDNVELGKHDVNRADIYGGRADFLFTPTNQLSVRISGYLQNIDRDGQATADFDFSGVPEVGSLTQRRFTDESFVQHFRLISGTINYDFGPVAVTSITSYQTMNTNLVIDATRQFAPLLSSFGLGDFSVVAVPQHLATKKFTQEVRLVSPAGARLEWLVGGFYTHERSENTQVFDLTDTSGAPAENNLFTYSIPTKYSEVAAFSNVTFHVTDKFDVSGGVRYARNDQTYEQIGSGLLIGSFPANSASEDVFTYLANARYHFSRQAMIYARFATGYRPAGRCVWSSTRTLCCPGRGEGGVAELRLSRLPDRTPVKMTIMVSPDLASDLALYAALYHRTYGREEPVAELVPAIIRGFLDADRAFVRARREGSEQAVP